LRRNAGVQLTARGSVPIMVLAASLWVGALAGCSTADNGSSLGPAVTPIGSRRVEVAIESSPDHALISVDGAIRGSAPVRIHVDIDDLGDVAADVELEANFADSADGAKYQGAAPATYRIPRGERPPSLVLFGPDGASAR
jgi:hypothetical protein